MGLQDQIYEWVKTFEPWKQELYLRAATSPELLDEDVREVASMLLGDVVEGGGPREVTRDDLPGTDDPGVPMVVRALANLQNVNIIKPGETLHFGGTGLDVVYGANGAGKTGYSRVLKRAGRTLYPETVLSKAGDGDGGRPRATVVIEVGAQKQDVAFDLNDEPPPILGRICVWDSKAGERYLGAERHVDYTPETLKSLSRFVKALKAVEQEIDRRIEREKPGELDVQVFGTGTDVARMIEALDARVTEDRVIALSTLSRDEIARRDELVRQLGEIEARQSPKLRQAAERSAAVVKRLLERLREVAPMLGSQAIEAARQERRDLHEAREASNIAATRFSAEPIGGAGSQPWRLLWQAAREFAEHQSQTLPPEHDPAHCLLCMQRLTPEARERLAGFDEFVRSDISSRLRQAENAVRDRLDRLPDVTGLRATHAHAIELLSGGEGPANGVSEWLDKAEDVVDRLKRGDLDGFDGIEAPPASMELWIAARQAEAASHATLEKADDQERVKRELAELDARRELRERRDDVLQRLRRIRAVDRLQQARAKTHTGGVSAKITTLSRDLVAADLAGALKRQLAALDFRGLEVVPTTRTQSGAVMTGIEFRTVSDSPLTSVLSQGEQRRLSLATFLAEMEVLPGGSPVIFDDPVSSIDQEGRRHIARTLARLAENRQVIVFTHEMSFVHELQRQAREPEAISIQHLLRIGETTGNVRPDLPWSGLSSKKRIGPLQEKLNAVRRAYESGDPDVYTAPVHDFCRLLREAFERTVEDRVLGGVITRRKDDVHTKQLDRVFCTSEICELVDRGMDDSSPWVHDRPSADGTVIPTLDELSAGLDLYRELHDMLDEAKKEWEGKHKKRKQAQNRAMRSPGEDKTEKLRVVPTTDDASAKTPA